MELKQRDNWGEKMRIRKCLGTLLAFALAGGLVFSAACSDDDDNNGEMCGNGIVEGEEECDGSDLNGQDCTTIGQGFTGGTLACRDYCLFDTSGCTGGSEDCGNGVIDAGEECDGTELDGSTCADVGNYTGGTLACATDCTYDTSSCEVSEDCGNGVIDAGEDCDGTELDGNTCMDVGSFTGGDLSCATDCTFDTSMCTSGGGPSEQIAEARTTADGTVNLPIEGAWVTYVKPAVGNDPSGFTIQAEMEGPALYIAVDPAGLNPVPEVGDEVTFTIIQLDTLWEQRRATAIEGWSVDGSGNDVTTLIQDVTAATDVVSALNDYESELLSATVEIVSDFGFAGQGHISAEIETTGITGNAAYLLRIPEALNSSLGLEQGCTVQLLGAPLWRFDTDAQMSAWTMDDIAISSCPAPQVISAMATADDTVVVSFNRAIDGSTVQASYFTFDNGLTASAATADATQVTVTTSTQAQGTVYTVTVASDVQDIGGAGVDTNANTAQFAGFGSGEMACNDGVDNDGDGFIDCLDANCASSGDCAWASTLMLWETDADTTSSDVEEFIEIFNNTGGSVDFSSDSYYLVMVNGSNDSIYDAIQLTGTLAAGEILVLGNSAVNGVDITFSNGTLQNGSDGIILVQCNSCGAPGDEFSNTTTLGTTATFTTDGGNTATKVDGIVYDTDDSDDTTLWDLVGVSGQWDEDMNGNKDTESLQRIGPDLWTAVTPTPDAVGLE